MFAECVKLTHFFMVSRVKGPLHFIMLQTL